MSEVIVEYRKFTQEELEQEKSYYREKRLHDEATALGNAKREGRAEGRAEVLVELVKKGLISEEQAKQMQL